MPGGDRRSRKGGDRMSKLEEIIVKLLMKLVGYFFKE